MPDTPQRGINTFAPWGAVLVAFLAAVYGYGVQSQRIDSLQTQVNQMQADARSNANTLAEIKETTTVIKTKLEILLPTAPVKEAIR